MAALSTDVEYLNSRDATIMGSRNGHAPIYLWLTLTRKGYEGIRKDVQRCLRNAHLLKVGALAASVPICAGWLKGIVSLCSLCRRLGIVLLRPAASVAVLPCGCMGCWAFGLDLLCWCMCLHAVRVLRIRRGCFAGQEDVSLTPLAAPCQP